MTGVITTVLTKRGFGFIRDEDDNDRFFHATNVRGARFATLQPHTNVTFVPIDDGSRHRAIDVEVSR